MTKQILKGVATIVALASIYHAIDWGVFVHVIRTAEFKFICVALVIFFLNQLVSTYRWQFILVRLDQDIPFQALFKHNVLGQMASFVLPGQVSGDVVKILATSRGRKRAAIALSVIIDKVALLLAVGAFALTGVFAGGPVSHLTKIHVFAVTMILISGLVILVLCQFRNEAARPLLRRILGKWSYIRAYVLKPIEDFMSLPRIADAAVINIIISACVLLFAYTVGAYFIALSVRIQINPVDWLAINAIVSFVQMFPVTVAGLGVREGAFGIILVLYGIPFSQSVVFSLTGFALGAILTSLLWLVLNACQSRANLD